MPADRSDNKGRKLGRIEVLRAEGSKRARWELLLLLDDHDWGTRERALQALWALGGKEARLAARAGLSDPSECVRSTAAEALADVGLKRDLGPLRHAAVEDPVWIVRASAASALAGLGGRRSAPLLRRLVAGDQHPAVRRYAAVGLADIGDVESVPVLRERLSREQESSALSGILHALYALVGSEYLDAFVALLGDDDYMVRIHAVSGLGELARPTDRPRVAETIRRLWASDGHPAVRETATAALRALAQADAVGDQ